MSGDVQSAERPTESRLSIEENGINVIPEAERKGKPSELFWPWAAANISVFGISYAAFILYFGVSFWQALVAALIGIIFSFVLVGFVSLAGKRASAPTMVISRASFGVRGNALPTAVSYLLLVGWEIVLVALATLATSTVFERLGWASGDLVKVIAFIVIAGSVIVTGVVGFELLMRVQTWITLISLALTVLYIAFTVNKIDWSAVSALPSGTNQAFIGAIIFAMTGFGIGWVNCGADYSRYLPRNSSGSSIFWWTVFGASISPVILIVYGLLLAGSDGELLGAIGSDPVGALTTILPTSALILLPFLIVVCLGFIGGAVLDIYSSGLALLTLGLKVKRPTAALIDGVLMVIGAIYVVWIADSFFFAFQGFLYTLGVPMSAWVGVFLADMAMRKRAYSDNDLYDASGRYGSVNWPSVLIMTIATVIGWGLVTNFNAGWLSWQGYLLDPLGLGPKGTLDAAGPWTFANIGIVVALVVGFVATLLVGRVHVRRQESVDA